MAGVASRRPDTCRRSLSGISLAQAHRALDELLRPSELDPGWDWTRAAAAAHQWDILEVMRAVCREQGVEIQMVQEDSTATWQLRETQELLAWIDGRENSGMATEALEQVNARPRNRWSRVLDIHPQGQGRLWPHKIPGR